MNEKAWEAVERDEARPIPTAPVGKSVQWYIAGEKHRVVPGLVQGVEGPGRLKIKVFPLNSMPQEKVGVYHVNHPVHDQVNNPTTYNRGSWDFVPGDAVLDEFFAEFREEIKRRKDNLVAAEKASKRAEAEFKERQAELASGKRPKRDILPAPASK